MPNCAQTHAHSHTHLTRAAFGGEGRVGGLVCDTGPQMSLVSRKLHYLSLAVADKAQRDATRCPDCSCCAVRHPAPPLPLAACSCAAPASQVCQCSAGTLKWRWLSAMRHCAVTHANFKTLSKSQQFFCSISAHRDRAGQGRAGEQESRAGLLLLWQLLRLLLRQQLRLLLLLLVLHFNCSAWCAARAINPAQVVH